jgi:hypothetical protein
MKYFIRSRFYNPSSHEMDFILIDDNEGTYSEEMAKEFISKEEAMAWCHSEEAKCWKPCTFDILESSYN